MRAYDTEAHHHFYVDTTKDPHRSIWRHPFDDDEYLATLNEEEREQIEHESMYRGHKPTHDDLIGAHSDNDEVDNHSQAGTSSFPSQLPPRTDAHGKDKDTRHRSFSTKMKDKLTGTTAEEREYQRRRRDEAERQAYESHMRLRTAVSEAQRTGQPQYIGKDSVGKDVFVQPAGVNPPGFGMYNGRDPFGVTGTYETPTAKYIRPAAPYGRPGGGLYNGGYGFPLGPGGGMMMNPMFLGTGFTMI